MSATYLQSIGSRLLPSMYSGSSYWCWPVSSLDILLGWHISKFDGFDRFTNALGQKRCLILALCWDVWRKGSSATRLYWVMIVLSESCFRTRLACPKDIEKGNGWYTDDVNMVAIQITTQRLEKLSSKYWDTCQTNKEWVVKVYITVQRMPTPQ